MKEKELEKTEKCLSKLKQLPFLDEIKSIGGKVYAVGGAVRDSILDLESKDLDVLVTGVDIETLTNILQSKGKIDLVGKSFGIIKFQDSVLGEVDIALPRTETVKEGGKHTDFDVVVDHTLDIVDDLGRRDFTINAMALDTEGNLVDPFGGLQDITDGTIRCVREDTFMDDPLRMMRAIQFASRFEFAIDDHTYQLIKDNVALIDNISGERLTIELQKMVDKGQPVLNIDLLWYSGLFERLIPKDDKYYWAQISYPSQATDFTSLATVPELLSVFLPGHCPEMFLKNVFKRFKLTVNQCKELKVLSDLNAIAYNHHKREEVFKALDHYPAIINTKYFENTQWGYAAIDTHLNEFRKGIFPKRLNELAIDGHQLMKLGFEGKEIGDAFKLVVKNIMRQKIENDYQEIKELLGK